MVDPGLDRTKPGVRPGGLVAGTGGRLDKPPSPSRATKDLLMNIYRPIKSLRWFFVSGPTGADISAGVIFLCLVDAVCPPFHHNTTNGDGE